MINYSKSKSLPWDVVEKKIKEEMSWLRETIVFYLDEEKRGAPITCVNCLLRFIAVLVVSGIVHVREIKKAKSSISFWKSEREVRGKNPSKIKMRHGQEWHRKMMQKIEDHFVCDGYRVVREPALHWGRADLGVFKKNELSLFIEVGAISLFKLWINLANVKNFMYLIVPDDDKLIEFVC